MNNAGKVFTAFIAGAAMGAMIGVLFAPAKGSKTRKRLKEEGQKVVDTLESNIQQAKDKLEKLRGDLEKKMKEQTEKYAHTTAGNNK